MSIQVPAVEHMGSSPTPGARKHLVLIPTFNSGTKLIETVREVSKHPFAVWVISDGSSDGSIEALEQNALRTPALRILRLPENQGKGAAVLAGMKDAMAAGYTHALVMDADGQHPPDRIPEFINISLANPDAMVLGVPVFGPEAPFGRRYGRLVGNWWAHLETLWGGVRDSLFGFRIYPIDQSLKEMAKTCRGRRFDFETELAVRLYWVGVRPINVSVPVKYFSDSEGGVSHFRYLRDNALLVKAHVCLVCSMLSKLARIVRLRLGARLAQ
jgi:glycosyltransferase involved in cell wall biosynthesis